MNLESNPTGLKRLKGWIFDVYPSTAGQMNVWFITENGRRIRLLDEFKPKFYVASKTGCLDKLYRLVRDMPIDSCRFVCKCSEQITASKKIVLEVTLKNYRSILFFVNKVLQSGSYLDYKVYNCDLSQSQVYLYEKDVFPFAFVKVEIGKYRLAYNLLDSVGSVDYQIPDLRVARFKLEIYNKHGPAAFNEPLKKFVFCCRDKEVVIDSGEERSKLFQIVSLVRKFDPDIIFTKGGDSFVFPYLARRAEVNNVSKYFVLNRDGSPLVVENKQGKSYFSYGQIHYRAPTRMLYGRIHVDESNTFILRESGIEGLVEIARSCRVPLHKAARSSIGTSMSSLQNYQALKDDVLVPRNKYVGEVFKSAYHLLVADRGGFVYEPRIGVHERVGEIDFSSMYPSLMAKYNISAETVLCNCCFDSKLRIPDVGYHVCEKKQGIVPKVLEFAVTKRLHYKKLVKKTDDVKLKDIYHKRQSALKWILVTCFGYLGYKNAKFGTVDGHMGVCAFGRETLLAAANLAEDKGFDVIHGIVDSLWLKKEGISSEDYVELCNEIKKNVGLPLNFAGLYKWIAFLPSKMHPDVPVLNRYYGAKEDGKVKVRGLELRRRDTPKFIYDAQKKMIEVLAAAENCRSLVEKIPELLNEVKKYKKKLLDGKVPVWDLLVTKRLSKDLGNYKQDVSQAIAAKQLAKVGFKVSAGKSVKFLFTSAQNKRHWRRVKAKELVKEKTKPDVRKYLNLLYSATSNILSPFGYSTQDVYNYMQDYKLQKILDFRSYTCSTYNIKKNNYGFEISKQLKNL